MKRLTRSIAFIAAMMMVLPAHAQSSKYQRPGKKKAAEVAPAAGTALNEAKPAAEAKSDKKSEKVDIQQIENDYWQQKDTEFHVVQSRRYTKEKKFFLSAGYGLLINDSFTKGNALNLSAGYYFKEQHGIEVSYSDFNVKNSKTTEEVLSKGGSPAYNKLTRQIAVTYNWMPIYGKVSVMDKAIIYYDLGLDLGLGYASFDHSRDSGDVSANTVMFVADITQQFFLGERWALRFDIRNRYYKYDRTIYRSPYTNKSDTNFENTALLGFVFYFDKNDFKKGQK